MEWRALVIVIGGIWTFAICILGLCYGVWRGKDYQPSEKKVILLSSALSWCGVLFFVLSAVSIAWHMEEDDEPFLHSLFHQTLNEIALTKPSLDFWINDCDYLNQNNYDICTDLIEGCEARRTCFKER